MAKRTSLVFDDEGLLRGVKEQAILQGVPMNQYIQDLIRADLREKVGCRLVKIYDDGTREENDLWSRYDAVNAVHECQQQRANPSFTLDGQTLAPRLIDWKLYEKGELVISAK